MKKLLFIFCVLVLLVGCKSQKLIYVPVEKETIKTEYMDRLQRDSIYVQDSIFIHHKGDTVFKEKYKYLYRDKLVRDSIFIHDSISLDKPYPVEVIKEVNRLKQWQIVLMILGGVLIGMGGYKIVRMFYSF